MRIKKQKINQESGLTLVEVLVTLGILTMVLSVAFSMFLFNHRTYSRGEAQSQVQFDVRMASDFITTELRNVNEVSLNGGDLTSPQSINLSTLNNRYSRVTEVEFELLREGNRNFIQYKITGESPDTSNPYQMESKVLLNNVKSASPQVSEDDPYDAVYYIKNY